MSIGEGWEDVWVLKLDEQGKVIWEKTFGDSSTDEGNSIQQTTDGCFVFTGVTSKNHFNSTYGDSVRSYDFWLMKLNNVGEVIWEKTYWNLNSVGNHSSEIGNHVLQTKDGGYFITGQLDNHCWVMKTDENGETLWST